MALQSTNRAAKQREAEAGTTKETGLCLVPCSNQALRTLVLQAMRRKTNRRCIALSLRQSDARTGTDTRCRAGGNGDAVTAPIPLSTCCGAPAIHDADNEVSETYLCTDCWKPCDVEPEQIIRCGFDLSKRCIKNTRCHRLQGKKCQYAVDLEKKQHDTLRQNSQK